MGWGTARGLLANSVVNHLGEDLTLSKAGVGGGEASVRGVLVRPEELVRLGLSATTAGDARLTLRKSDAPSWLGKGRGVTVESESGETYDVTAVTDNGEGVLEVMLCRSS